METSQSTIQPNTQPRLFATCSFAIFLFDLQPEEKDTPPPRQSPCE